MVKDTAEVSTQAQYASRPENPTDASLFGCIVSMAGEASNDGTIISDQVRDVAMQVGSCLSEAIVFVGVGAASLGALGLASVVEFVHTGRILHQ